MEIIDKKESSHRGRIHGTVIALLFIVVGLIILGHNLGWIGHSLYRVVISWQMLLIALGVLSLIKKQNTGGAILILIGAIFLLPHLFVTQYYSFRTFWPLIFVLVGVILIARPGRLCGHYSREYRNTPNRPGSVSTENGFITSYNTFGSVKQIVLEPLFKGAMLTNKFAGTILDLRHTSIEEGETYIDIDCSFGGIEIYVPHDWNIKSDINAIFSGIEDKRFQSTISKESVYKLIIRGNASFSGIEIKD